MVIQHLLVRVQHSDGIAPGQSPNTYHNNIFAYARKAMFGLYSHGIRLAATTLRSGITSRIISSSSIAMLRRAFM